MRNSCNFIFDRGTHLARMNEGLFRADSLITDFAVGGCDEQKIRMQRALGRSPVQGNPSISRWSAQTTGLLLMRARNCRLRCAG